MPSNPSSTGASRGSVGGTMTWIEQLEYDSTLHTKTVDPQLIARSPALDFSSQCSRQTAMLGMNTDIPSNQDFSPECFNSDVDSLNLTHQNHSEEILAACENRMACVASFLEDFDPLFGKTERVSAATDGRGEPAVMK